MDRMEPVSFQRSNHNLILGLKNKMKQRIICRYSLFSSSFSRHSYRSHHQAAPHHQASYKNEAANTRAAPTPAPLKSIAATAAETPALSTLLAAVKAAGLAETLSGEGRV